VCGVRVYVCEREPERAKGKRARTREKYDRRKVSNVQCRSAALRCQQEQEPAKCGEGVQTAAAPVSHTWIDYYSVLSQPCGVVPLVVLHLTRVTVLSSAPVQQGHAENG